MKLLKCLVSVLVLLVLFVPQGVEATSYTLNITSGTGSAVWRADNDATWNILGFNISELYTANADEVTDAQLCGNWTAVGGGGATNRSADIYNILNYTYNYSAGSNELCDVAGAYATNRANQTYAIFDSVTLNSVECISVTTQVNEDRHQNRTTLGIINTLYNTIGGSSSCGSSSGNNSKISQFGNNTDYTQFESIEDGVNNGNTGLFITYLINSNPVINSNITVPATPRYGLSTYISANVTDVDDDFTEVNFTLIAPNGTKVIDNQNASTSNGDIWNSSAYTIDNYGTWYWWVNVSDTHSGSANNDGSFSISLGTLTITTPDGDQTHDYSDTKGTNETFNLTFSHDGNSNNTIEFTTFSNLSNSSRFLVYFEEEPSTIQYGVTKNISVTIQTDSSLTQGTYTGIIEVNRTDDSSTTNITVTATVYYAVPDLQASSFTITMNESSTKATDFTLRNLGNWNATNCNLTFTTTIDTDSESWNISSFLISNSSDVYAQLSITSNSNTGTDNASTILLNCTSYTDGSYETEIITGTFTVEDIAGVGGGAGGGAGGGTIPAGPTCGNGYCERYEDVEGDDYCPEDCITADNITIMVSPDNIQNFLKGGVSYNVSSMIVYNPNTDRIAVKGNILCIEHDNVSCQWLWFIVNDTLYKEITFFVDGGTPALPGVSENIKITMIVPENVTMKNYRADIVFSTLGGNCRATMVLNPFGGDIFGYIFETMWDFLNIILIPFDPSSGFEFVGDGFYIWELLIIIIVILIAFWLYYFNKGSGKRWG